MDGLKIDNPARRLLDLPEEGKGYCACENCRAVSKTLLHTDRNAEHHILIRLSQVMALPERPILVRDARLLWKITWNRRDGMAYL